jgi:hypothetical protein
MGYKIDRREKMNIDMDIKEARYIVCTVYESYSRLMHLPPSFMSMGKIKDKNSFKAKIAKSILLGGTDINNDVLKPIFKEFPELEDELESMVNRLLNPLFKSVIQGKNDPIDKKYDKVYEIDPKICLPDKYNVYPKEIE